MEFHETQGGHQFYYGTMPKLVSGIEKTNQSLDELAKAVKAMCENTMPAKTFSEPTETNFQMLKKIKKNFKPEAFGILSEKEAEYVKKELQLECRSIMSLRNLRDMSVILLSGDTVEESDLTSAVTAVIDQQIFSLGGEV